MSWGRFKRIYHRTLGSITPGVLLILCVLLLEVQPSFSYAKRMRLVVWGLQTGVETKDQDAEIAAFEKMHPDIKVEALSMGAGAMNPQKLMTSIVGGVPPDVVYQDRFTIGDWASRGAFRSLNDLLAQDAKSKSPYAVRQKNFVPATWAEATYKGQVYAIPDSTDDRVLYYNKTLFREVGLNPNKPPQTWSEMISDAVKLTKRRSDGSFSRLGFIPVYGQGWLYLWSWQEDGEFMSPDGRYCTMNNPQTLKALTALVNWYDILGGVDAINSFAGGFAGNAQDPFMTGKLAMKVDGDGFINSIARYHPEMDFGVCPVPVPDARFHHLGRFKHDPTWVTWSGGFAWAIPNGSKHLKASWEFIQWMTSPQAKLIGAAAQSAYAHSLGRLYVPPLYANNLATQAVFKVYKPTLPYKFLKAKEITLHLLPYTKFRPVTFVGQYLWDEHVRAVDAATRHVKSPEAALAYAQEQVQIELNKVFTLDTHPVIPIVPVMIGFSIAFIIGFAFLGWKVYTWMRRQKRAVRSEAWAGFLFASPWIFGFLVFTFGPILASLVLSFCDYDVLHPARWAGLNNYITLFTLDRHIFFKSIYNAFYLAFWGIPLGIVTSLSMAMLLNTKIKGQQFYRTAFYMPSIVPIVATSVLWAWLLNSDPSRGLVNAAWQATITHWFHIAPPGWLAVPLWAKPALILIGLWGAGGGMIIWLAGLQSIPVTLYEAASIDGAKGWSQFWNITIPMLSPYIFFNLIMGTIGALQTFATAYILGNTGGGQTTGPDDSLLVPVVYLFNNAFQYFKMGYASALAWILFIIILGLTLGQLKLAPKWVHYEVDSKG
jgi:ABC-type sugar transport system permease subunit/ABC-type glycerol-3-phosphate transport system substrate-binding protein